MEGEAVHGIELFPVVAILLAGVVAVPIFRRIGLGSVLGYLAAGVVIGPFGFQVITHPEIILHTAELGVVMFLFVIGLEMQPRRLWGLRREIFGLGVLQVSICAALMTGVGVMIGLDPIIALIAALGFVLTSTAIVFQVLEERGQLSSPQGQKMVSVLLLEDLAIVPLLAFVASPPRATPRAWASAWSTSASLLGPSWGWFWWAAFCSIRFSAFLPMPMHAR